MTADTTVHVGPDLLDPAQEPPLDRYCDVVMKGGVTDGVVYPWAVMALAQHYRFQSIGGTSVGAVAAALTAASE
jgi:predicted acylesterase/phospholipase RssA